MSEKRRPRALAKLYVSEWLRTDDQPEWIDQFYDPTSDEAAEFMDELARLSERLFEQVPKSIRDEYRAAERAALTHPVQS